MTLGGFFDADKNPEGFIGFFNLKNWWLNSFTDAERKHIREVYCPMGGMEDSLVKGKIEMTSSSLISFLTNMAGWFDNPEARYLALKMIDEAEQHINENKDLVGLHFFYATKMKLYYKNRDLDPKALQTAVDSCLKQIELAEKAGPILKTELMLDQLPSHEGYTQLCIILEKQGKFDEAIRYSNQAKDQGWNGDWDNRITRCLKKMKK